MIKVLAIDDEPLALLQLQKMIETTPYFQLVSACSSAFDAMQAMEKEEIDAIYTDINMPDLSGLDFVRSLPKAPILVFTTAYSQYAIDGYKVNAIDYLLKPFGRPEFQRVAEKVKQQYELIHKASISKTDEPISQTTEESHTEDGILFVKTDYRIVRISLSDIRYIESQGEYLKLHLTTEPPLMVLMSIKRMIGLLPSDKFVRIHRSYIVNMSHVLEISHLRIKMDAKTFLPISISFKDEAMKYIVNRMVGK